MLKDQLSKHFNRMHFGGRIGTVLALLFLLVGAEHRAVAQFSTGTKPDVQVVVMLQPTGQWGVSAVYPHLIPRAVADAHIRRLLAVSGWKASGLIFEDASALNSPKGKSAKSKAGIAPVMSSATFITTGAVGDWREGTFDIESFARAYRDLSHIYITYLVPSSFVFHGLRNHSDSNIDVMMQGNPGAYTYLLTVKNHQLGALGLPRHELTKPGSIIRSAEQQMKKERDDSNRNRVVGTGLVVLLAAVTGIAVYVLMNRMSGR